ncbi:restriction endonuclease subunit S [Nitrosomonas sp. ANs5]|uniref:restriction endonuclease subunit S n=1 Tax=Nitrosomonas sp. ANs5 TaxID=3423941 RepID=UPI003D336F2B
MGGDWKEASLADLYDVSSGLSKPASEFGSGHPFLGFKDVFYNYFVPDVLSDLVQSSEKEQTKCSVKRGDVFLTRTSETMHELGMSCVALKDYENATFNGFTKRLRPKQGNYLIPEYVGYYLRSKRFRNEMLAFSTMSTRASLNNGMIAQLRISYPDVDTQKSIAHILKTLDDKIELNRQMNATLEAMAQALFKSWFVDFDPVIDNALAAGNPIPEPLQARAEMRNALGEQRKPLPAEFQRQFPNRFVFTEEMGWVPEGWEVKPLDSIIELIGGGTPKTSNDAYWDGDIPWFSVVDAPSPSDVFVIHTEKTITQEGLVSSLAKLLPKGTTIISARGTVGKCAVVARPMAMNQSCYGIRGLHGIPDYYTYYTILLRVSELQQRGHGSVFNTITRDTFKTIKTCVSNHELLSIYDETVTPYMGRIVDNIAQVQSLSRLRDTLLPKLLSGQLRIPEAEAMIERAGVAV